MIRKFRGGKLIVGAGAITALRANGLGTEALMLRHLAGDWGDACKTQCTMNEDALGHERPITSYYTLPNGDRICVQTALDRETTTFSVVR